MVSWGGRGVTQLCVTSPAPVHLCLGCQLMESGERDIQPQPDPEIDRKVETLVGGVRSQNTDGGLYCARLSAFYLWCAWHNLHLAFAINELSQNTRKVLLIICAGPMCLCIVYRGKNWVVSDVGTWSRRSYAIDCEYSSSSAPAPSTYKHSTYLGPSSDTISHYD